MPDIWKKGIIIVTLPKKGNFTKRGNWRGVTLLLAQGKIFAESLCSGSRIVPIKNQRRAGGFQGWKFIHRSGIPDKDNSIAVNIIDFVFLY